MCILCGKLIERKGGAYHRYCSRHCVNKSLQRKQEIVCELCGKRVFQTQSQIRNNKHHYCSKECMGKAFRKSVLWEAHNCRYCGKPIKANGGHYRFYCSNRCHMLDCPLIPQKADYAKWRDSNYIKSYMAKYTKTHREELNIKARIRLVNNPKLYRAIKRKWARAHPVAVRLLNYNRYITKKNGKVTVEDWEEIKKRYNYSCACCGQPESIATLEIDHIIPLTQGGEHTKENIQPLCRSCNARKNNRTIKYELPLTQGVLTK